MLSDRPWTIEATLRLFLSIVVCYFLGMVATAVVGFIRNGAGERAILFYAMVAGCLLCSAVTLWILRRPWRWEGSTWQFALLMLSLYAGLALGGLVQYVAGKAVLINPTWRTVIAALSFQGLAILFVWRFVREHPAHDSSGHEPSSWHELHSSLAAPDERPGHRLGWAEAFGFKNHWPKALIYGAFAACLFLPSGIVVQFVSAEIMSYLNLETPPQPAVEALGSTVTWLDRTAIGIVTIGIAPFAEELLFRGILYPAIKRAGYPRLAFWGTSFFFAAIHLNLPTFAPLFLLALALTWLYEKTENLLAPVTAHTLFNAMNFIMFYSLPWAEENFRWLIDRLKPS